MVAEDGKPESFRQENYVSAPKGRRGMKAILIGAGSLVLIAAVIGIYFWLNTVTVPNMVGMTLDEATAWATKNKITLSAKSIYNFDTDSGIVLTQEVAAGKSVSKNSAMSIEVSLGADPDEKIEWPDIETMMTSEIEAWISQYKLTGINIVTANSDIVAADEVISYSLTDGTEENFQRKSRATITVSIGPASESDTVVVTDFSSMNAGDILLWGSANGVTIQLSEAFDDYISSGSVVSQSVKADTEIEKTVPISVVISKGKAITVPDFTSMSQDQANAWAKLNNVTLTIQEKYSKSNNKGKVITQSIKAGTSIKTGDEVDLTYSLGRIDVSSFVGKNKMEMLNWQNEANTKGADITITFTQAYGGKGTSGQIISQSVVSTYVDPGTKMSAVVSLGMQVLAPDFSGMTEQECSAAAQAAGITVLFNYQYSSSVTKGVMISQSPVKGTVMSDAETVTVNISTSETVASPSKITVPDFTAMTKDIATSWAKQNNITLTILEKYTDTTAKGIAYNQSAASGSGITQGSAITVTYSLGKVDVTSFIGKNKLDIMNWLDDVNEKGGNITAVFADGYGDAGTCGMIISQSVINDYVNTGSTIQFSVSLGKEIVVPDLMTPLQNQSGCTAIANSLGMKILYNYQSSSTVAKDYVISQSVSPGTILSDADTLIVVISLG